MGRVVAADDSKRVDFTRDVRPILADKCFHCHGPDPESRQADLRLDMWESTDDLNGAQEMVVPGDVESSELVSRITAEDAEKRYEAAYQQLVDLQQGFKASLSAPKPAAIIGMPVGFVGAAEYVRHIFHGLNVKTHNRSTIQATASNGRQHPET